MATLIVALKHRERESRRHGEKGGERETGRARRRARMPDRGPADGRGWRPMPGRSRGGVSSCFLAPSPALCVTRGAWNWDRGLTAANQTAPGSGWQVWWAWGGLVASLQPHCCLDKVLLWAQCSRSSGTCLASSLGSLPPSMEGAVWAHASVLGWGAWSLQGLPVVTHSEGSGLQATWPGFHPTTWSWASDSVL